MCSLLVSTELSNLETTKCIYIHTWSTKVKVVHVELFLDSLHQSRDHAHYAVTPFANRDRAQYTVTPFANRDHAQYAVTHFANRDHAQYAVTSFANHSIVLLSNAIYLAGDVIAT